LSGVFEGEVKMELRDGRGKQIIYVNNCLLNQNARFPGAAVREGAFTELVQALLDRGLSIEQLPCLECIGLGGVARRRLFQYRSLLANAYRSGWYPLLKPFMNVRLWAFKRRCKQEAINVVKRMKDYLNEGYTLTGVIGVNDSPTCGVTRTMDIVEFIRRLVTDASSDSSQIPQLIQQTLVEGTSYFVGAIMNELRRRGMDVKVVGFEPWVDSPESETQRVLKLLDL
jgi:predicted secreted protein